MPDLFGNNAGVPASFTKVPSMAKVFSDNYEQSLRQDTSPQTPPQPQPQQPVMESAHVEQPGAGVQQQSIVIERNDAQSQQQTQPLSQPQPQLQPQPQPQPDTQYQSYLDRQQMAQLAAERDALYQQLAEARERERQWQAQQEVASLAQQLHSSPEFQELGSVDPEDAQRIAGAAARVLNDRIGGLQKQLDEQRYATQQGFRNLQRREAVMNDRKTSEAILRVHPDFMQLSNDANFRAFLAGHDGKSSKSRDQRATEEFYAGNADYVIDLVNRFKQGTNPQPLYTNPPVQVAGSVAAQQQAAPQVDFTLRDLNTMMQMRQITPDEYREKLKQWKAANNS